MTGNHLERDMILKRLDDEDLLPLRERIEEEHDWCARFSQRTCAMFGGWRLNLAFTNARLNELHGASK